jgi:drug/metabolite transporter (DMT)-like permease
MARARSVQPVEASLLLLAAIWGSSYGITKTALAEMAPLAFNAVRFLGAAIVLLAATWWSERDLSLPRQDWWLVFWLGLIGHFLHLALYVLGLARTTSSNASLIIAAAPIFVACIGAVTGQERLSWRSWAGIGLAFAGIFLIVTGGAGVASGSPTLAGDLMEVGSSFLYAVYLVLLRRLGPGATPLKATMWSMWLATPLLWAVAVPDLLATDWRSLSGTAWFGMAYSGLLAIALASVIWQTGVQRVGSTRASVYSFLSPLIALIVGRVFLHEVLSPWQTAGVAGVLVGVALARRG